MKFNPYLIPDTKIYPKCIINLNVKPKIMKLIEENIGEKFYDLGLGKDFMHMRPKE